MQLHLDSRECADDIFDCNLVSVPSGDRASPELTDNSVSLCLLYEFYHRCSESYKHSVSDI